MSAVKVIMEVKLTSVLRQRLSGKNLSKIASELGISRSLLADWVSSRRIPSLRNIESVKKIADYLGLTLEQLLLPSSEDSEEQKIISNVTFEDQERSYRISIERLK